jgi:hypothetical protein
MAASARVHLRFSEYYVARNPQPLNTLIALSGIQHASYWYRGIWSATDVARALRIVDQVIRSGAPLGLQDIISVSAQYSNLGDECGARIVEHATVEPDIFSRKDDLIFHVGPRTLKALLRAGANPNIFTGPTSPLAQHMGLDSPMRPLGHRIPIAALLIGAGVDPADIYRNDFFKVIFRPLLNLYALWVLYAVGNPNRSSAAAVRFVARDGDLAIARRVHAFLVKSSVLTFQ